MAIPVSEPLTQADYERAALDYLKSLPLEHFMEAEPQAKQREITIQSLAVVKPERDDIHYFNELLVQYVHEGMLRQVVPDNMIVLGHGMEGDRRSFNVELEPVAPLVMLEYVSASNPRKDYEESFSKYERELKTPYYVLFYPKEQDLRVYHHTGEEYEHLSSDSQDRYELPELELKVGLLHGWMRFWFRRHLCPLPAQLKREIQQQQQQIQEQQLQLQQQGQAIDAFVRILQTRVERAAGKAGRQDILDHLPETRDPNQLDAWLSELSES